MSKEPKGDIPKQTFNRIRTIEARDGNIVIKVRKDYRDESYQGGDLKDTILSIEAAQARLIQLKQLALRATTKTNRENIEAMIEEIEAKIKEAITQREAGKHKELFKVKEGSPDDEEFKEALKDSNFERVTIK